MPIKHRALGIILVLLALATTACQIEEPLPTPTPTRTPIIPTSTPTPTPTNTPTATPTVTPTPTPTLPPDLLLPPQAANLAADQHSGGWPPLPTDLYFLRDGRLHSWLAEGGGIETIPIVTASSVDDDADDDAVLSYRISRDKRFVAYVTTTGKLYIFDRAKWQHTFVPTAGYLIDAGRTYFDITADARYLVYMAWGVQPTADGSAPGTPFGTILAIDLADVRQPQIELGFCTSAGTQPCTSLLLSSSGTNIAFADGEGLWISQFERPEAQLLLPTADADVNWHPKQWSPDGQWLVLEAHPPTGPQLALLNSITGKISSLPDFACTPDCQLDLSWGAANVWLARNTATEGCLVEVLPETVGTPIAVTFKTCQIGAGWSLHPTSPQALPEGGVVFVHRGCGDGCPGPAPGIYALTSYTATRTIALLGASTGSALWTADGSAFLHVDAEGQPTHVGTIGTLGFWDVRQALEGAHSFHWGALSSTQAEE